MVAVRRDPWQAGAVPPPPGPAALALALLLLGAAASPGTRAADEPPGIGAPLPADGRLAQSLPHAGARAMSFQWTLYPRMWAEIDLRMGEGAVAVAEIAVEGGEVSWNLHAHPEARPEIFEVIESGRGGSQAIRCAPSTAGWYSYLFGNDAGATPVRLRVLLRLTGEVRLEGVKP